MVVITPEDALKLVALNAATPFVLPSAAASAAVTVTVVPVALVLIP